MKVALRLDSLESEALSFVSTLCDTFACYGIEIVSVFSSDAPHAVQADYTVVLGEGTAVGKQVFLSDYSGQAAKGLAFELIGASNVKTFAITGLSFSEVRAKIKGLSRRSIKVVAVEDETNVFVHVCYGSRVKPEDAQEVIDQCAQALGESVYAAEKIDLPSFIVAKLLDEKRHVSLAESFTGGGICARLTAVAGASAAVNEGIVSYTDESKHRRLEVSTRTMMSETSVSANAVYQMAVGLLQTGGTSADIVIATSGYAGPTGKNVGHCFVAVGDKKRINVYEYAFKGDRASVTKQGVTTALQKLYEYLKS